MVIKKTTRGSGGPIFTKRNRIGFMADWCGPSPYGDTVIVAP